MESLSMGGVKTKRERTPARSRAHRPCAQAETTHGGFSRSTIFQGLLRSHWDWP